MKNIKSKQIIEQTKANYNLIAPYFSSKRQYLSEDILYFKKYLQNGIKVLDNGCGNGRLLDMVLAFNVEYVGTDFSEELIKIAQKRYPNQKFIVANSLSLPFKNTSFDLVFCLSVIHHIPSKKNQKIFVSEIRRVLKKDGIAIITSWKLNKKQKTKIQKISSSSKNVLVPFTEDAEKIKVDRYVYLFSLKELEKLFVEQNFRILESGINKRGKSRNIYLVVKK